MHTKTRSTNLLPDTEVSEEEFDMITAEVRGDVGQQSRVHKYMVAADVPLLQSALHDICTIAGASRDPVSRKYDLLKAMRIHFPEMLTGYNRRYLWLEGNAPRGIHAMNERGNVTACGLGIDGGDEVEESLNVSCNVCARVIMGMRYGR